MIVFDDADLGATAEGIAGAAYFNAGQDCTAATRVLAGPRVYGTSSTPWSSRPRARPSAPYGQDDADFGPLNNEHQLDRVRGFLERTPEHAKVRDRRRAGGRPRVLLRSDRGRRPATRTTR